MVWGTGLTSRDRAGWRVRLPSPPGQAILPTIGASVTAWYNLYKAANGRCIDINGLWSEIGNIADRTEHSNDNDNNNNYYYCYSNNNNYYYYYEM